MLVYDKYYNALCVYDNDIKTIELYYMFLVLVKLYTLIGSCTIQRPKHHYTDLWVARHADMNTK